MRNIITYLSLSGSLAIFGMVTDLPDTVLMFLLFGIVPGRTEPVSAELMLLSYVTLLAVIASRHFSKHVTIQQILPKRRPAQA